MKTVFLDMDGVIADFIGAIGEYRGYGNYPEMYERGFFENLEPMPGALVAVRKLIKAKHIDLWILSQPVKESAHSYSEKAAWMMKWFPDLSPKIILTQEKGFLSAPGRHLIDDSHEKWHQKWTDGGGTFLHFQEFQPEESWEKILKELEVE